MPAAVFTAEVGQEAFKKARALRFWKIFIRLFFVILKVKGYFNEAIADILSVSRKTVFV